MRIKKKEAVVPFRETVAYRTLIVGGCLIVFVIALYILVGALMTSITTAIISGLIALAGALGVFWNLDQLRNAKIPKKTLTRMKRR